MGIVSFYGEYLADVRYPRVHTDVIPDRVLSLSLDMNGIFHQSAQAVYAYGENADPQQARLVAKADPQHLELEYFQHIAQRLGEIIFTIKPQLFLVLAVDGVAPFAKISQQRSRRYKSSLIDKRPSDRSSRRETPARVFDPNCITPGTELMSRLDNYLQRWIATNQNSLPDKIIYSSHLVRGEGEHKIFQFIRQGLLNTDEVGAHVIYGLDADLVMLSSLSEIQWLYLCRENFKDIINISAFKFGIIDDLSIKGINPIDPQIAIQDFVLMLYLIGNDFLPHLPSFHHVGQSIDIMFSIYQEIMLPLTSLDEGIQWENLSKFISILAEREPALLHQVASKDYKYPSKVINSATLKTDHPEGTKVEFDYDKFRIEWYRSAISPRNPSGIQMLTLLGIPEIQVTDVHQMCHDYLKGLQWILQYYTRGNDAVSKKYVYRYNHAPLLYDLSLVIKHCIYTNTEPTVHDIKANVSDPIFTPIHQLLAVMPPSSINLIPFKYRSLMDGGILTDLCPWEFLVEMEGINKEWQGIAMLPHLDPYRVISAVDTITYGQIPLEYEDQENIVIENINKSILGWGRGNRNNRGNYHGNNNRGNYSGRSGSMSDNSGGNGRGSDGGRGSNRGRGYDRGSNRGRGTDPSSNSHRGRGSNRGRWVDSSPNPHRGRGSNRGPDFNRGRGRPVDSVFPRDDVQLTRVTNPIPPKIVNNNWSSNLLM
jgi:5'-3' exonuclease